MKKENKKKNDFLMWLSDNLFSDKVLKALNWLAVVLIAVWVMYHVINWLFTF